MSTLTLNTKSGPAVNDRPWRDQLLEELAEAALTADIRAKDAAAEAKSATDAFRKALAENNMLDSDTKAVGIVRTTIFPTKRFDETLARTLMTKKLQKECEKTVLDAKLVEAKVSPETYTTFQKVSGMTLKLSIDKEQG